MKAHRPLTRFAILLLPVAVLAAEAAADSSIDATNRYSYGANVGWIDWRGGNGTSGAVVTKRFAGGSMYSANIGWVSLGDGSPANGTAYANGSATDFGVNVAPSPDPGVLFLSGYAYSANAGWISFENTDPATRPRVEKVTGILRGSVYGANVGWLPLEQVSALVVTDSALLVDAPTATPTVTPTATASPTPTATPTVTVTTTASPTSTPLPGPDVVRVLLGLIAATDGVDANGDGIIDAADIRVD